MRAGPGRAWTKEETVGTIFEARAEIDPKVVESACRRAFGQAQGV
jgi:hypothetical protein